MDTIRFIVNGQTFVPPADMKFASQVASHICKVAGIKPRKKK